MHFLRAAAVVASLASIPAGLAPAQDTPPKNARDIGGSRVERTLRGRS
jgi:hypothetical protein